MNEPKTDLDEKLDPILDHFYKYYSYTGDQRVLSDTKQAIEAWATRREQQAIKAATQAVDAYLSAGGEEACYIVGQRWVDENIYRERDKQNETI